MALELKCVIEPNLIRAKYHCISRSFHFNSYVKQLYVSNKMEQFSYKGGYGIHGLARIEAFKRRAGLHGIASIYSAWFSDIRISTCYASYTLVLLFDLRHILIYCRLRLSGACAYYSKW